jgi:hypothetical protein
MKWGAAAGYLLELEARFLSYFKRRSESAGP